MAVAFLYFLHIRCELLLDCRVLNDVGRGVDQLLFLFLFLQSQDLCWYFQVASDMLNELGLGLELFLNCNWIPNSTSNPMKSDIVGVEHRGVVQRG